MNSSFNPCFSGWRSERYWCKNQISPKRVVSILVFLDGALKEAPGRMALSAGLVSILVFLDGALKEDLNYL